MPCELNRSAYEQLLREDLEWLLAQPRTLERDHIADLLRWSLRNPKPTLTLRMNSMAPNPEHAVFHSAAIPGLEDYAIYSFPSKEDAEAWMIKIIREYARTILRDSDYDQMPDDLVIDEFQTSLEPSDYFHCYPVRKAAELPGADAKTLPILKEDPTDG